MPVATSSRRKLSSRRQDSFDIENTRSNQVNGDDDDVSEDDELRHKIPVKQEKKTNGKAKGKQKADPEEEEDVRSDYGADDDDDEDRIVVDNFPDHPLQHSDLLKLKGISKDWESMQRQTWDKWDSIKDVAAALAEARDGDPNQEVAFTFHAFALN
jgi:E3 SUMO-protein ligase NSE2